MIARQAGIDIEVLLLLRNGAGAFGDHWVFPGGRIDSTDYPDPACEREYDAALNAVIRETREEAALDIAGQTFHHVAHWTTPETFARRFSTWFFVCLLDMPGEIQVDGIEILDYRWLSPDAALQAQAAGAMKLPIPTLQTLKDIRSHRTLEDLRAALRDMPIRVFPEHSSYYRFECITANS